MKRLVPYRRRSLSSQSEAAPLVRLNDAFIRPHLPRNSYSLQGPPSALQHITWSLGRGENWLFTGPNGSGKSTLARALFGKASIVKGELVSSVKSAALVSFADHERVRAATDFFLSHGANLKQEGLTVGSFLVMNDLASIPSDFLQVTNIQSRTLASLSSGELRRVYLLKALQSKPQLLVLDEAFDFLDEDRRLMLASMLNTFAKDNPQTRIILVSHRREDAELVTFLTNELSLTSQGTISRVTKFRTKSPESDQHKQQITKKNDKVVANDTGENQLKRKDVESSLSLMPRGEWTNQDIQSLLTRTRQLRASFQNPEQQNESAPLLTVSDASVRFETQSPSVMRVESLKVLAGDRLSLYGPSGAGKSLLLSIIAGEHPQAFSNDIRVFGRRIGKDETLEERRRRVALFSHAKAQSLFTNNPHKPAFEVVLSGLLSPMDEPPTEMKDLAKEWLALLAPSVVPAEKPYLRLSQGQRAATLLARTLASSPSLVLLDEPFAALDVDARARLSRVIENILESDKACAVIGTSHYAGDFDYFPRKIWLKRKSRVGPYVLVEEDSASA